MSNFIAVFDACVLHPASLRDLLIRLAMTELFRQGPTETAFYLYGKSAAEMKSRISTFVASYPLCRKCRIERIA